MGSVLTNKYAEGYPGRRYYGGCEVVDVVEDLAIARAKELFGAEHANVQPHSGAQANMAVYFALLKPGDVVLGPNLSHGGHLTAGSPVNYSGKFYSIVAYGVRRDTERVDLDEVRDLARAHRPRLIIAGGSAFPRAIDFAPFGDIAREVGAVLMADIAHPAGLVAAGLHPSPVGIADFVTTTTHKTLRGPRGGLVMCRASHAAALDRTVMPGVQGGPLMHVIAGKAVALREALTPAWKAYQGQIVANARALAEALLARGFRLVTGGTDTHLLLVDLTSRNVTGKDAQEALDRAWITVNKNTIPFESRSPMVTSGIRLGTPAVTTRGMREGEMAVIAGLIDRVLAVSVLDCGSRGARRGPGAHRPLSALSRGLTREGRTRHEVSLLWSHRGPSRGFPGGARRGIHPAPPGLPQVPPALHHLRVHRGCPPHVVKRDGRREPFDRQKLRGSILKACQKQSVAVQAVDDIVADIESKLHDRADKEIPSHDLGELVMEYLQKLDQIAYVRFASVYRQFKDPVQFMDELKDLLKEDKAKLPAKSRALTSRRGPV